jgi:hypothetical protein
MLLGLIIIVLYPGWGQTTLFSTEVAFAAFSSLQDERLSTKQIDTTDR